MARIFISSTITDLQDHRQKIKEALQQAGHDLEASELFSSGDERPVEECCRRARQCDLYLGILGWRYGHQPNDHKWGRKSVTELEYWSAVEANLECLFFLVDENAAWIPKFIDEGEPKLRLREFKDHVQANHFVRWFKNSDELATHASAAVGRWQHLRDLGERLHHHYSSATRFSVVTEAQDGRNSVLRLAARSLVSELSKRIEKGHTDIMVGLAGGPTTRAIVERLPEFIPRHPNVIWPVKFVSLNAAGEYRSYHYSANFQVTRLSEIFRTSHLIALPRFLPEDQQTYESEVKRLNVVLCSCGDRDGFLFEWLKKNIRVTNNAMIPIPSDVIGDFCLTPIDQYGKAVELPNELNELVKELKPYPAFQTLDDLRHANCAIILPIMSQPRTFTSEHPPAIDVTDKTNAVRTVLRAGIIHHFILSEAMAQILLAERPPMGAHLGL